MQFLTLLAATLGLVATTRAHVVGVPAAIENALAVEIPSTALAARDDYPPTVDCDGLCSGSKHCCLIVGQYSRCHSPFTPCSRISFPDGLSADSPHAIPTTTFNTSSSSISPVSASASSTSGSGEEGKVTITTTITQPSPTTTVKGVPTSGPPLVNTGDNTIPRLAAQKAVTTEPTTLPISPEGAETTLSVEVVQVTQTTVVTLSFATPAGTTVTGSTTSEIPSMPIVTSLSFSFAETKTAPTPVTLLSSTSSEVEGSITSPSTMTHTHEHTSTITSITEMAATTEMQTVGEDGGLFGEPSAVASDLSQANKAARGKGKGSGGTIVEVGWVWVVRLGMLVGMGLL